MPCGAIDPRKTHPLLSGTDDAVFTDADAMRVAAQVFDHLGRTTEGWLGIDD